MIRSNSGFRQHSVVDFLRRNVRLNAANSPVESGGCIDFCGGIGEDLRLKAKGFRPARITSGPVLIARFFLFCLVCLSAWVAVPASAQVVRPLPADLVLTTLQANGGDVVLLGETRVALPPAAQVRGTNNLIILSSQLYGTYRVGVKRDHQGLVSRIWILTDAEYQALKAKN